jgi:hypothetical protein
MAKDSAEVVAKLPPPNGWQGWPMGISAAMKLGISVKKLAVLVQTGNITCYKCPDRTNRYDPEQIEVLVRDIRVVSKAKFDEDGEEGDGLDDLEEERSGKSGVTDSVNKTLVEALKNSNAMVLEMHKLLSTGTKAQAETQDKVIGRLLEREESYQKTLTDVYVQREAYFNQQAERDIAVKSAANLENRRNEIWNITKGHLDKLVDVAFVKFGIPKEVFEKLEPAIELLQKLTPTQLQMLLGSGFLTPQQEDLVKKIVKEVPPPEDVSAKVTAECAAILQKQADDKKAAQAARTAAEATAAKKTESVPPAPANEATNPAPSAGEDGPAPTT